MSLGCFLWMRKIGIHFITIICVDYRKRLEKKLWPIYLALIWPTDDQVFDLYWTKLAKRISVTNSFSDEKHMGETCKIYIASIRNIPFEANVNATNRWQTRCPERAHTKKPTPSLFIFCFYWTIYICL